MQFMSSKEVPDIGEMYDFYKLWNESLKDEIMEDLLILLRLKNTVAFTDESYKKTAYLMKKIESERKAKN
jgi:hypothetical protein